MGLLRAVVFDAVVTLAEDFADVAFVEVLAAVTLAGALVAFAGFIVVGVLVVTCGVIAGPN